MTFAALNKKELFDNIIQRSSLSKDKQDSADYTLQKVIKDKSQQNFEYIKDQKEYLGIFGDYVNNSINWKKYEIKKSYSLIEDIALIYYIGQDKDNRNLSKQFFTQLLTKETRLLRSAESLRDRYKKYLCYLKNEDFVQIVTYLMDNSKEFENGIQGNIIFERVNDKQQFKTISKQQINFENKNQNYKYQIRPDLEFLLKANLNERMDVKKIKLHPKLDFKIQRVDTDEGEYRGERIVKSNANFEELKYQEKKQIVQEMFNLTNDEIIKLLDQVTGDWKLLIKYLYTKEDNYFWNEHQDLIIKQAKNKTDQNLALLIQEKGVDAVRKRIRYNQTKLEI